MKPIGLYLTIREFFSFFHKFSTYLTLALFQSLSTFTTLSIGRFILNESAINSQIYFQSLSLLLYFFLPALSMGTWIEERKNGTLILLKSLPLSLGEIVLYKSLGVFCFYLVMILTTFPFILMIYPLGNFDLGIILTQYIGLIFMGIVQLSFGMLMSSLFDSQIITYLITLFLFIILMMSQYLITTIDPQSLLYYFLKFIAFPEHIRSFQKGLLNLSDCSYLTLLSAFFLYLTTIIIRSKKGN